MKRRQLSNGKLSEHAEISNQNDWASIKINRAFRSPRVRKMLPLNEPVLYLKETIVPCDDFYFGEYMVTIVCNHNQKSIQVPLGALILNERQKGELVEHKIVRKNYFSSFEGKESYVK